MSVPIPDDVPVDDALEQQQPVVDPVAAEASDTPVPMESDPGDWQEQQQVLDDLDPDDERR